MSHHKYRIWTDGSVTETTAGWGAVILPQHGLQFELKGSTGVITSTRAELLAAYSVVRTLAGNHVQFDIRCDCKYVVDGWNIYLSQWRQNQWTKRKGGRVPDRDLWEGLIGLVQNYDLGLLISHVKGHNQDSRNNLADRIARRSAGIRDKRSRKRPEY